VEILNDVLKLLSKVVDKKINIQYIEKQYGDVNRTSADIQKAKIELGFNPKYSITQGLTNEIDWVRTINT
jgi:nucleoside-diphosphate-sugar epimerase